MKDKKQFRLMGFFSTVGMKEIEYTNQKRYQEYFEEKNIYLVKFLLHFHKSFGIQFWTKAFLKRLHFCWFLAALTRQKPTFFGCQSISPIPTGVCSLSQPTAPTADIGNPTVIHWYFCHNVLGLTQQLGRISISKILLSFYYLLRTGILEENLTFGERMKCTMETQRPLLYRLNSIGDNN